MRRVYGASLLLAVVASAALAAPPEVPTEIKAEPGQLVRIVVKTDAEIGYLKNFTDADGFFGELVSPKGQRQFVFQPPAKNPRASYVLGFWTKGETEGVATTIVVSGVTPAPEPKPVPPDPKPDPDPEPIPEGAFRVIFVWETSDTLTPAQHSTMFAQDVANFLAKHTTRDSGGWQGWRRYDKDDDAADESPEFKELWASVKSQVPPTPAVVIAKGKKVTIEPLPATPAEMIALLQKYKGGK